MRREVEQLCNMLQTDLFADALLSGIVALKNESYIIYDEEGSLINGHWYDRIYSKQDPGVRSYDGQNFAIYDTRYNPLMSVEKKYSEFIHELFHCYQLRMKINYASRRMIEGAALLVESVVYSRYVPQKVDEILECYGQHMNNSSFMDYFLGAKYIYEKMLAGLNWTDYFMMRM